MPKTWVVADWHLGHQNILRYCNRPWTDVTKMDRDIVRLHNSVVGKDDVTYVLGDVTLKSSVNLTWLTKLVHGMNGKKILIFGNHDGVGIRWDQYLAAGFQSCHSYLEIPQTAPTPVRGTLLTKPIALCHNPAWAQDKSKLWVCGHLHQLAFKAPSNIAIVCVELTDYKPVLLSDIVDGYRPGEKSTSSVE
jgi:calcineurin-like phosphoesterase family protein